MNLRNAFQGTLNKFSEAMLIKFVGCTSEAIEQVPCFRITGQDADKQWAIWSCGWYSENSLQEQMRSAAVAAELLRGVGSSAVSTNLTCFLPMAPPHRRVPECTVFLCLPTASPAGFLQTRGWVPSGWRRNWCRKGHSRGRVAENKLRLLLNIWKSEDGQFSVLCGWGSVTANPPGLSLLAFVLMCTCEPVCAGCTAVGLQSISVLGRIILSGELNHHNIWWDWRHLWFDFFFFLRICMLVDCQFK